MAKTIALNDWTSQSGAKTLLEKLQSALTDQLFNTGGLAIGTSSKKAVLLANTVYALIDGALVTKTTAEIALVGTVTNGKYNVYALTLAADGTLTVTMGTEGATLAAVVLPTVPADEVTLGYVIVHPSGTGNFVGGTTDLDDGTVVPNAVYINNVGAFNANVLSL